MKKFQEREISNRPTTEIPVGDTPAALALGDLNNDAAPDAVVVTAAGVPAKGAGAIVLPDFNGDGNLDAAVANTSSSSMSLFRGDGTGNLAAAGSYLTGRGPSTLAASDLDTNSGTANLIAGDSGSQDLTILLFPKR